MCDHDDTRLIERARDSGRRTREGEQFVECRSCGAGFVRYADR